MRVLFILALFGVIRSSVYANPIQIMQDPIQPATVRLSDGRIVPFGPGVICKPEVCETIGIETTIEKKWLAVGFGSGAVLCAILCRPSGNPLPIAGTAISKGPDPVGVDIPEVSTLTALGTGLLAIAFSLRRRHAHKSSRHRSD